MLEDMAIVARLNGRLVSINSLLSSPCRHCLERSIRDLVVCAPSLPSRGLAVVSVLNPAIGDRVLVRRELCRPQRAALCVCLFALLTVLAPSGPAEPPPYLHAFFGSAGGLFLVRYLPTRFSHCLISPWQILEIL